MQDLIFGVPAPKMQQGMQQGSPRGQSDAPHPQSPRQAHLGMAQSSPPNLPSPLPMRSPGSPSPSNMPLDHLLMLANLTNNQNEDWAASPHAGNSPSMSNAGNCHPGAFRAHLVPLLPIAVLHVCTALVSAQKHHQTMYPQAFMYLEVAALLCVAY